MDAIHKPKTTDNTWHLEVPSLRISCVIIILQMEHLNNKEFQNLFELKSQFKESGRL